MNLPCNIITDRLLIRPFQPQDMDAFLAFMSNEEITRFLFSREQKSEQGAKKFFEFVLASYETETPVFACAITLKDSGVFIGSCGISKLLGSETYECYYSLLPEKRGHGYATEATRALLEHCFANYSIKEFRAYLDLENPDGAGVAMRVGMKYVGLEKHPISGDEMEVFSLQKDALGS